MVPLTHQLTNQLDDLLALYVFFPESVWSYFGMDLWSHLETSLGMPLLDYENYI